MNLNMRTIEQENSYILLRKRPGEGLQILFKDYGQRLYSYAIRSWQISEDDALELIYQTLSKVIKTFKRYEFKSEKKFGSFVFTVFCNLLRQHYRDQKRRSKRLNMIHFDETLFDEAKADRTLKAEYEIQVQLANNFFREYWEEGATENIHMVCLQTVLDELESWERILLLLRAQNVPYSKISEFIDKPTNQLKVLHQRARKKLKKRFFDKLQSMNQEEPENASES